MYRDGVRVRDLNGNQFDVPLGVFTAALPLMSYDPVTNTFKGAAAAGGSGDFVGPGASVDNHLVLFNGITGKLGKDTSPIVAAASGNLSGIAGILASGTIQGGAFLTGGTITSGLINGVDIAAHGARHNPGGADTMFTGGTMLGNDFPRWSGAAWIPKLTQRVELNAALVLSAANTTLQSLTGLAFTVARAGTYWVEFMLDTHSLAAATLSWAVNVSANLTRMSLGVCNPLSATAANNGQQVASRAVASAAPGIASGARALVGAISEATRLPVSIFGSITVSGASTFQVLGSKSTSTLTISAGSCGNICEL